MELNQFENELREQIIKALKEQGFKINPHLRPVECNKEVYRSIQLKSKFEQMSLHKKFLLNSIKQVKNYCRNGYEISPEKITLQVREVKCRSMEEVLFKWWNLVWWSIPYQRPYGRQLRFLLWDISHDAPFGLIGLQSPVLKLSVRDKYLELPKETMDIWVNMSMNAQRVGALPPYNQLIGGKMVALALTCNEIRDFYRKKYGNTITILQKRKLKPELLFITTTSAFGKSSIYNRLKYNGETIAINLGYTRGAGTFHIPESLYEQILKFLSLKGVNIARGYGYGPSRKIKLITLGLRLLGLFQYEYHGIKREFYLFPLVKNLKEVIQKGQEPIWIDRPFGELVDYWKKRWALPRAERISNWKYFNSHKFFEETEKMLKEI
ncbi:MULTISPECIES: Druantia anti-phage system protein DruA [Thermodesulfovibrio]|jgi:hypothetical protein|uniref:Druantia anti-phage system protein DruA n=1 Tax=Thermodesulfovibrio TaxID=28261 RepID=UPI00260AD878|nr:Druantia anti-phage system protein DruA [Thermodesulfovibrio sp.]